jgi:hypothetical protein
MTLRDGRAPTTYRFDLALPSDASLVSDDAGGYDVVRPIQGTAMSVGHLDAPWARDAAGRPLPTKFSLASSTSGTTLVQSVDVAGAQFPVQADPHYTWGWVTGTVYFNKRETRLLAATGSSVSFIASLPGPWQLILRGYAAYLLTTAGVAVAQGKCLKVKSTLSARVYSGGYCT